MFFFALGMSISPGPVNMLIVAAAANFGLRKTWALVSGATFGFVLLLLVVGFGLSEFVHAHAQWLAVLSLLGTGFVVFVAYKMAQAPVLADGDGPVTGGVLVASAPTFQQGLFMQWLNPKAWVACAAGTAMFAHAPVSQPLWTFVGIYFVVCYASLGVWAVAGGYLAVLLRTPFYRRVFNWVMAGLLCATAMYMLYQQWQLTTSVL